MKHLRMTRIRAFLLGAVASAWACTGSDGNVQVLRGSLTATDLGAPAIGVRVVRGNTQVASVPVRDDGSFEIQVPPGTDYRLEVVGADQARGVLLPGEDGTLKLLFDVCQPGEDFDFGNLDPSDVPPPPCFENDQGDLECAEPLPKPPCEPDPDGVLQCDEDQMPPCLVDDLGNVLCGCDEIPPPCLEDPDGNVVCEEPVPCLDGDPDCEWPPMPCPDGTDPDDPHCGEVPPPPCYEDADGVIICDEPIDPCLDGSEGCIPVPGCDEGGNCDEPDMPCTGPDGQEGQCGDICLDDPDLCWPNPPDCSYDDPMCWPDVCQFNDIVGGDSDCFDDGLIPDNPLPPFGCEQEAI